jgi:PAS domain S-box-containing protein
MQNTVTRSPAPEAAEDFCSPAETGQQKILVADRQGAVKYVDPEWSRFTGRSRRQFRGWRWTRCVHPDDMDEIVQWRCSLARGLPFSSKQRWRSLKGGYRWHISHTKPVRNRLGYISMWVMSSTDMHDLNRVLDEERSARQEAERTSLLKDEFIATMAHELRAPQHVIQSWAQILMRGHPRQADLELGLRQIEQSSRHQARLIAELFDMSRIVYGKMNLRLERVQLRDVIETTIAGILPEIEAKGVQLERTLEPATVVGDPDRLSQVIWNLLSNATKFTPADGTIRVVLKRIDDRAELLVCDTGEGFGINFLPHLFERFQQRNASTSSQTRGLGLGLAIVKELVQLHGGTVRGHSPGEGLGAVFSVTLPLVDAGAVAATNGDGHQNGACC